jgi:hypothetical protein
MTKDELLKLMEQGKTPIFSLVEMYALVENAVLKEREACLKMLDANWYKTQSDVADAIRARGET